MMSKDEFIEQLHEQRREARSHLHAILVQAIPADDKIIINYVTAAYLALGGGLNDFLKDRPFKGGA